jgi:1-phosphofructokinase family hexose kinase
MKSDFSIITVGLCPAWDVTCYGERLDWGQHKIVTSTSPRPAGKAMNISRALAWMGEKSVAAGLWGREDYQQMLKAMQALRKFITVRMTAAEGSTRRNITVVDIVKHREMHLRHKSELVSKKALRKLNADLEKIVSENSICIFAGLMPEREFLGDIIGIIKDCANCGARTVVDTSGDALKQIVDTEVVWLIKPNVEELCELVGRKVRDEPVSLAKAGWRLLDKVEIILISRGRKGAVAVTKEGVWQGCCVGSRKVLSTVGCGDYLLAGFLKGLKDGAGAEYAMQTAIKAATAKAWGWTEIKFWPQVRRRVKVRMEKVTDTARE